MFSTADAKVCRATREQSVAKLQTGLEQLARSVREGRRCTDAASVARRVGKLFGQRGAARYFRWELQPLTAEEQAVRQKFQTEGVISSEMNYFKLDPIQSYVSKETRAKDPEFWSPK